MVVELAVVVVVIFNLSVPPSVPLSICPSLFQFPCPSACNSIRLSVPLSAWLSVTPSICLSVRQHVPLSTCLSVRQYVPLSTCHSVRQYVPLSVCLSVLLSVCISVRLPVMSVILSICPPVYHTWRRRPTTASHVFPCSGISLFSVCSLVPQFSLFYSWRIFCTCANIPALYEFHSFHNHVPFLRNTDSVCSEAKYTSVFPAKVQEYFNTKGSKEGLYNSLALCFPPGFTYFLAIKSVSRSSQSLKWNKWQARNSDTLFKYFVTEIALCK